MKKLILGLFILAFLNTNAQVVLSPAEKILLEKEVKLICTQDRAYFESLMKDKAEEKGTWDVSEFTLKTRPFANISLTSGFEYHCSYHFKDKNAAYYTINVSGKGEEYETFYWEILKILQNLTKEGFFGVYRSRYVERYWMKMNDSNEIDEERGTFSFSINYSFRPPFTICSRGFLSQAAVASLKLKQNSNVSTKPVVVPVVILAPELADKYKTNMEAGDKAMAASDYLTAITKFETAVTANPQDGNSQLMLCLAHEGYIKNVSAVTNPELYNQHRDLARNAIVRANRFNPENPVIMYYNWTYFNHGLSDAESIVLLDTIIKRTNFQFREAVYRRCRHKLLTAEQLQRDIDLDFRGTTEENKLRPSYDKRIKNYKSMAVSGLQDFQFIVKNYAAEPLDIYQYAGISYLREYKIDSAVYCLQKVKDNAERIKWINYDFEDFYETAKINQIRLKHTSLENIIKSDNLLKDNNFTAAITTDNYNAKAYVKRAEANENVHIELGLEHLKEEVAIHKLIAADYEIAKNIYPAILHGKVNDVIAFMNKWIYRDEHYYELNDLTKRTTTTNENYSSPTVLYNSANTPSTYYETLLKCSYCNGTGEKYSSNGGSYTATYYLLGGTGLTSQRTTYNSNYSKCDKCNGTGRISY